MQSKLDLQDLVLDLVKKYNSFYENIDSLNYQPNHRRYHKINHRIPLLNFIQKKLFNKYNIKTTWSKKSKLYIVNYNIEFINFRNTSCLKKSKGTSQRSHKPFLREVSSKTIQDITSLNKSVSRQKSNISHFSEVSAEFGQIPTPVKEFTGKHSSVALTGGVVGQKERYLDIFEKPDESEICKMANGVIFDKKTNHIVCFIYNAITEIPLYEIYKKYDRNFESKKYYNNYLKLKKRCIKKRVFVDNLDKIQLEWNNYDIYDLYDGTLIKLFYYNNEWCTATNKCVNASHSKWISFKPYSDLFNDINLDYSLLNKKHCYAFILLHPENKLVCKYPRPIIVHLGTFDLIKLEEVQINNSELTHLPELDINTINNGNKNVYNPKIKKFDSLYNLIKSFDEINKSNDLFPGYFLINKKTGKRIKIANPKFKYIQYIKGNNRNMIYRIIDLQKNPKELQLLLYYFPEYSELNEYIHGITKKLVFYIYTQWHYRYINTDMSKYLMTNSRSDDKKFIYPEFKTIFNKVINLIKMKGLTKESVNPEIIREIMIKELNSKQILNLYGALMHNVQCTL